MKKTVEPEELDRLGNKMAQLVDGQAEASRSQFEEIFHADGALRLQSHPDWGGMASEDQAFAFNLLACLLVQNACAFQRRIVDPVGLAPVCLLALARVRYDIRDSKRQELATNLLSAPAHSLDINSLKIIKAFKEDLTLAKDTGRLGLRLFCTLKALRRMWKPSVIEQERLNKQLSLMGERAPGSSLDLLSARLALKYHLGAAGFREQQLQHAKERLQSKTKKWSTMRPVAASVVGKCVDHWSDGISLLSGDARFADTPAPDWCPSKADVRQWTPVLDPRTQDAEKTVYSVAAAAINRRLFKYWMGKASDCSKSGQNLFCGVAMVAGNFEQSRPLNLPDNTDIYIFGEAVNRSVRIVGGAWQNQQVNLRRPWTFGWAANVFLERLRALSSTTSAADAGTTAASNSMQAGQWPLTIVAFPISWRTGPPHGFHGVVQCDQTTPGLTAGVFPWEEDTCQSDGMGCVVVVVCAQGPLVKLISLCGFTGQ